MKKKFLILGLIFLGLLIIVGVYLLFEKKFFQAKKKIDQTTILPESFRVSFVGDSGVKETGYQVFDLIKKEKTDLLVHLGDFDYEDNPEKWKKALNDNFDQTFPIVSVVGNHDLPKWDSYKAIVAERESEKEDLNCEGEPAVKRLCYFKDLKIVASGIGTFGTEHESFIEQALRKQDTANFEVCAWHKNQTLMQVGSKSDDVGWRAFEICREEGAFIAMGHEHSYERTKTMTNFTEQLIRNTEETTELILSKGQSFAFVSGLGGKDVRDQKNELAKKPWWAKVYTKNQEAKPGAVFCDFRVGSPKAECCFRDVDGNVQDNFSITRK